MSAEPKDATAAESPPNASDPTTAHADATTPETPLSASIMLMQPHVNFDELKLIEKIGHGSFGVVYKADWREKFVAVKEFEPNADQTAIQTEVKQLSRVRHDNIIALYGISERNQCKYLIMEYAEGGSLHNFLHGKVKPYYTTAHAMSWARQCAEGVAYLHAMKPKPMIHRDLKPLNLLLTNKGRLLKICDFGTVADKSTLMTNNKGSAAWMAPEVFEGSRYTEKCDIFSFGIVLWEMLSREQPFKEMDNTLQIMWKIHKGERPPPIKDCPERIQKLMTSCWATVPEQRPAMDYIVTVMNELTTFFTGADEPLEYEFVNQQIIRTDGNNDTLDTYTLDFSSYTSSTRDISSGDETPTNLSVNNSNTSTDSTTSTNFVHNSSNLYAPPTAAITASTRWDVIPEEEPDILYYNQRTAQEQARGDVFNLTTSPAAAARYETIRNDMSEMGNKPLMGSLNVDVDPNAWDLNVMQNVDLRAKTDGRERLTVTDAKPMRDVVPTNSSDDTDLTDEDETEGPDQSFHEMLDPELQPEQPIPNNAESQKIYREHRRLAKEYLRVDTNIYFAQDLKDKLLLQMDPAERQEKQELLKKMSEKDELMELYNNLKQQLEKIRAGQFDPSLAAARGAGAPSITTDESQRLGLSNDIVADDGWVVIDSNENA